MRAEDQEGVRGLHLFAGMAQDHFDALMQAAFLQRFPAQVQLIVEGEPADFLFVVIDGLVELYANQNGRETSMELVPPVSTFILAAVLRDQAYLMSGRTLEKSHILMIPAGNIRDTFAADDQFARAIVHELSGRYRTMVKALKNHKLRTSVERLANYLLFLHGQQGASGSLELPVDKRTVAAQLGMTPENLSRAFRTLGPYGVDVQGATIALTKPGDLETLAKPTPLIDDPST